MGMGIQSKELPDRYTNDARCQLTDDHISRLSEWRIDGREFQHRGGALLSLSIVAITRTWDS